MSLPSEKSSAALSPARRRGLSVVGNLLGPFLALGCVFVVFGVADQITNDVPTFFSLEKVRQIAADTAVVAVAALGMTVVIIAGGIDLSAGTALALCSTVLAYCLNEQWPIAWGIALTLLAGCGCGMLNGFLISVLRVVPFIVTLGTMMLFQGIAKKMASNEMIRPSRDIIPEWLQYFLSILDHKQFFGFPMGIWVLLGLGLLTGLVLRYSVWSRYVYALGSNEATARLCGINVTGNKIAVYTFSGLFVGIAGLFLFANTKVGMPTQGTGLELKIIAAVVIGGGSLNGGRGSVIGTLTGAAIIYVIQSGCTQLEIDNAYQDMILGLIIISAVMVDQYRQRRMSDT
jgi:ribose/xylose/arabinose/galactoside ABC-type transport system permease subunit